jgi:hypothetical protein
MSTAAAYKAKVLSLATGEVVDETAWFDQAAAEYWAFYEKPDWMADGACREHPEVNFIPSRGMSSQPAKDVCSSCLVRDECLAYAMDNADLQVVWGETTATERIQLRRSELPPEEREARRARFIKTSDVDTDEQPAA